MYIDDLRMLPLNIGKAVRKADWIYTDVCSPFARIYYVVSGTAMVTMGGKDYPLHPGHLFLIPPFVKHSTTCKSTFVHYYIHVYEDNVSGIGVFNEYDFPAEVEAEDVDRLLFERLVDLNLTLQLPFVQSVALNEQCDDWAKIETRRIVQQFFSRFFVKAKAKPFVSDERIVRGIRYIHEHLGEPISVPQLADVSYLSVTHLVRLFRRTMGMPPMVYTHKKRIERAQLLLHTTNQPIKDIASSLGYPNSTYFIRVFKQSVGLTPVEYRNYIMRESDTE